MIVTFCGHRTIYGYSDSLHIQLSSILTDLYQKRKPRVSRLLFIVAGMADSIRLSRKSLIPRELPIPG